MNSGGAAIIGDRPLVFVVLDIVLRSIGRLHYVSLHLFVDGVCAIDWSTAPLCFVACAYCTPKGG